MLSSTVLPKRRGHRTQVVTEMDDGERLAARMSLDRRSLLAALAGLFSAPALARTNPRHPHTATQHRERPGAGATAHPTSIARRHHLTRAGQTAEAGRAP